MTTLRLHPWTLVHSLLGRSAVIAVILVPTMMGRNSDSSILLPIILVYFACIAIPFTLAAYYRFRYWTTPTEIVIHSGIFTRNKRHIPYERIQNIGVERNMVARILGTAIVRIETASSSEAEGILKYVDTAEADRIRSILKEYRQDVQPVGTDLPSEVAVTEESLPTFTLTTRRLFLSGVFRFSLLFVAVAYYGLQYAQELWGLDDAVIGAWMSQILPEIYEAGEGPVRWLFVVGMLVAAILLAWLSGIILQVVRYFGFKLVLDDARLHKRHGLLTVVEGVIPLKRIQALIIRTQPLMRRYGWYRLKIQTVGLDRAQVGHQVGIPFATLPEVLAVASHIRPFTIPVSFHRVSRRTIRRRSIRYLIALSVLVAFSSTLWNQALWFLLLAPACLWLAYDQWRKHQYAIEGGFLFVRKGVFAQKMWVIPKDRFQVFYRTATYFQRRLGLRTVLVDTAGGLEWSNPGIIDLAANDADKLMLDLYEEFNHQAASL